MTRFDPKAKRRHDLKDQILGLGLGLEASKNLEDQPQQYLKTLNSMTLACQKLIALLEESRREVLMNLNQHLPPLVLVEDNDLIRLNWEFKAKKLGIKFIVYTSGRELMNHLDQIPVESTIFLDSDLGEGEPRGEELAELLYRRGYHQLFLQTGFEKEEFAQMPWFKAVGDKTFPDFLFSEG